MRLNIPTKGSKVMRIPVELEPQINRIIDEWKLEQISKNFAGMTKEDRISA